MGALTLATLWGATAAGTALGGGDPVVERQQPVTGTLGQAAAGSPGAQSLPGPEADVSGFGDVAIAEERGDVVEIPVEGVTPGEYVTVTLGSRDAGYLSNVTVHDEDGDGRVTLRWNSYLADRIQGSGENPWSASGGDSVVAQNVQSDIADGPTHVITTGTYTLEAREGRIRDGAADQPAEALGSLTLESRSTDDIETWTAPEAVADELNDPSDIESRAGSELTRADDVAAGDVLVTRIEASGLEGALRAQDGDSATAKFYGAVDAGVIALNHTHLQEGASNQQSDTVTVNARETSGAVTVLPDYENGVYYVVHETSEDDRFEPGRSFRSQFTVAALFESQTNYGLVAPDASGGFQDELLTTEFDVVRGRADIDTTPDGPVTVRSRADQTISGTSTYAPGTTLQVRIQAKTGSSSQFIIGPREATVDADGTWAITADFSQYNVGSTFTVHVQRDGEELALADGEIRGAPEVIALQFDDQAGRGSLVAVTEVELNYGGFVAIHADDGGTPGEIIGVSGYVEENEPVQNLQIPLEDPVDASTTLYVMPHIDANNDQSFDPGIDEPYTSGGAPVTDSAQFTLEGARPDFTVSSLSPAAATVTAGDVLTISATVTNEGSAEGTQTVEFRVGGRTVESRRVTLAPGESVPVEALGVDTSGLDAGSVTHGVYTDDDSQTGTLTVEAAAEARFEVRSVDDRVVSEGESATLSTVVTNTGEGSGTQRVELRIDGQAVGSQQVTLAAGEATTVEFADATAELSPGAYTYTVATDDASEQGALTVEEGQSGSVESLSLDEGSVSAESATVAEVELSAGGFVAIHEGSATGPVVGVSDYLNEGQQYSDLTVSFDDSLEEGTEVVAVAHYDTNGNQQFDYAATDGGEDTAYATGGSAVASQSVSGADTETEDDSGSSDGGSSDGIVTTLSDSLGGFGPVALAGAGVVVLGIVAVGLYRFRGAGGDGDTAGEPAVESGAAADDGPPAEPPEGSGAEQPSDTPGSPPGTADQQSASGATVESGAADEPVPAEPGDSPDGAVVDDGTTAPTGDEETVDATTGEETAGATSDDEMADATTDEEAASAGEEGTGEKPDDEAVEVADDGATETADDGEATESRTGDGDAGEEPDDEATGTADDGDEGQTGEEDTETDDDGDADEGTDDEETAEAAPGDETAETATDDGTTTADQTATDEGPRPSGAGSAAAAGAAGAAGGSSAGDQSDPGTALERGVAALDELTVRHAGSALTTYGATMATRDGDLPVEVVTVAPEVSLDPSLLDRFERIAGQWYDASTHPNVRTLHDWGTDPRPYLTVDALAGADPFIDERGSMVIDDTVAVVGDVAEALAAVRQHGGYHHNLSLECIEVFAGEDGYTAVVGDWGIERAVREHADGQYVTSYTAPEQLDSGADERADVYGLGAVTYHAMTGQPPVRADPDAVRYGEVTHPNEFVRISPQTDVAIMSALAVDPADRHATPREYARALADARW